MCSYRTGAKPGDVRVMASLAQMERELSAGRTRGLGWPRPGGGAGSAAANDA